MLHLKKFQELNIHVHPVAVKMTTDAGEHVIKYQLSEIHILSVSPSDFAIITAQQVSP